MNPINHVLFKTVVMAQLEGKAAIPYGLGLDHHVYKALLVALADTDLITLDNQWTLPQSQALRRRSDTILELTAMRIAERNTLVDLLYRASNPDEPYSIQAAIIIATACLSSSHLWKTLGLKDRAQLRVWLDHNFPSLVAKNTNAMRWKRFFYLQLCQSEGDYVCQAPSCEACSEFCLCFGTEE